MHLTKSQLLIGTLLLFLLLSCTFMVYQYNHEEHLHTTSLQNELQSINERIYSILEFKYNNTYSNNCAAEISLWAPSAGSTALPSSNVWGERASTSSSSTVNIVPPRLRRPWS